MPRQKGQKNGFCSKGHPTVKKEGRARAYCPICFDPEARKAYMHNWYRENTDIVRNNTLMKNGWTLEKYEAAFKEQNGVCDICNRRIEGNLRADHKHGDPPKPRGLLCDSCNLLLGHAKDSPIVLEAAAAYLRKHGEVL
jgi:hypothetical protein